MASLDIDKQIQEEIERIRQNVVEITSDGVIWKPRTDIANAAEIDEKRAMPTDMQLYADLQLSRGASRPQGDESWTFDTPDEGLTIPKRKKQNTDRLAHFQYYVPFPKNARILDMGIRNGQLLYFLKSLGYTELSGMDIVRLNVLWCQKNGFNALHGDAHDITSLYPPNSFDVVFAYQVFEHLYDPKKVIDGLAIILSDHGSVHLEYPLESLDFKTAHVYSFEQGEVAQMLTKAGFHVIDTQMIKRNREERIVATKQVPTKKSKSLRRRWHEFANNWL